MLPVAPAVDILLLIVRSFFSGFIDSISFHRSLTIFLTSKTIRSRFVQCFVLNGVIFLGSLIVADNVVKPLLHMLLHSESDAVDTSFDILYNILWTYPVYLLSNILTLIWYSVRPLLSLAFS